MCRIPDVIGMMPQLTLCAIVEGGKNSKVSGKQEKEGLQLQLEGIFTHSLCSSKLESLYLNNCDSDGFFPLAVAWFPNLTELDLRGSNFTILPECIQEFRFLRRLVVDNCEHLREIRGSPPCLTHFSAIYCKSLSPTGTSVLLNQELHQNGECNFVMPGRIPRWFEQGNRGASISFWFRGNYFPRDSLHVAILLTDDLHCNPIQLTAIMSINGKEIFPIFRILMEQLFVFDMSRTNSAHIEAQSFEKEWNHAKVSYSARTSEYHDVQIESIAKEIRMHVCKQKSSIMQDI